MKTQLFSCKNKCFFERKTDENPEFQDLTGIWQEIQNFLPILCPWPGNSKFPAKFRPEARQSQNVHIFSPKKKHKKTEKDEKDDENHVRNLKACGQET